VIVASSEGSYIYNKGVIEGGFGYAIGAFGAPVTIENKGRIYGYALLHTSNNVINNQGTWFAYGNSFMGYGNDVVNNKGIIDVAPLSLGFTSPTTVFWDGVTVFNNSNLVDLRNGHTGDLFVLNGTTWNGLAGSTLGVDASLSSSLHSDEMIIGAANGSTTLVVNDTTPGLPGALNFTGTTVVHGTSGSASDFTWAGRTKGFINYELEFFSGPVNWNIVALPSNAAFEMLKAPEMAQDFWRRTGDAWSAREQEVRDSMWGSTPPTRGEGWEMWAQAQVGGERLDRTENFTVQGMSFSPNLATDSDWRGFQMGGDNWTSKNWLWGFTGGFLEQNSVFHFDKNSLDITGWNVGAYTGFTSGAFFANGLIKGDWYDVKANMHTVPAIETFSGNTWGAKGEAGFRFGTPHLYFEPLADIAWTSTHLDNANFPAQDTVFTFGNATSTRGSIGARVGGQWGSILPYVGLYAAQEFGGKNKMTMITGGGCANCDMDIEDLKPGAYERADFGFTTTSWNGLEGFLKGEAEFGGHTDGFTGRLGVRWKW
jgi:trimeric autotransporter adhesin